MSLEPKYLYLTTIGRRSGRPRRIEIWFTRHASAYYLVAEHGRRSQWVQNLAADPAVRARVGARSFRAHARVVDPVAERELVRAVRRLSEAKYGWGDGLVIELRPIRRAAPLTPSSRPRSARRRRAGRRPPR
ncbi:MAG TPA: nitroreductase family deazaflavin-dependent oxidoreductase [Methylomirabilota bacterium]|nr:nitroreductase family deazaflavin-dependent oxidoreductase [Methylomirabilota bacterium]